MLIFLKNFIISNFWWALIASSVASGFAGGYVVRTFYQASHARELKLTAEKLAKERAESLEASKLLETRLAVERAKRIEMEGRLRHELQNRVYTDCVIPPSGLQLLREAVGSPAS